MEEAFRNFCNLHFQMVPGDSRAGSPHARIPTLVRRTASKVFVFLGNILMKSFTKKSRSLPPPPITHSFARYKVWHKKKKTLFFHTYPLLCCRDGRMPLRPPPYRPDQPREMPPHPGYSKHAAIDAIRRHAFNFLPREITVLEIINLNNNKREE